MTDLTDIREVRRLAEKHGFRFQKGFGQNFLVNPTVLDDTVQASGIGKDSCVMEIGPGFGTLTQRLCAAAGRVLCLEIDTRLLPVLDETLVGYDNYTVIRQDALKADFGSLLAEAGVDGKVSVVANLPYYISTPILMKLMENRRYFDTITVMLQKEVAQRVAARENTKDYGALSVAVQYACDVRLVRLVDRQDFYPAPKVDSAVVTLRVLPEPRIGGVDEAHYFRVVRAAFSQRRKTLQNALAGSGAFAMSKEEIAHAVRDVCGDENIRGEALSLEMFGEIAKKIF